MRARYYDPRVGRFNRLDPFAGNINDPLSLHKSLYTHGDPVNGIDPSGLLNATEVNISSNLAASLDFVYTLVLAAGAQNVIDNARAYAQLELIAQQLGAKVYTKLDDIEDPRNSRLFVHGSNSGDARWLEGLGVQAIGSGDFGTGFYTFANTIHGIIAAANFALGTTPTFRTLGQPPGMAFVLFVSIEITTYNALSKRYFGYPTSPTPDWEPVVSGFYEKGGIGTLDVAVAIGPFSRTEYAPGIGFQYFADVRFPNQYKFEDVADLRPYAIIPAVNIVGPQLA